MSKKKKKGYETKVGTLYDANAVSLRLCTHPDQEPQNKKKTPIHSNVVIMSLGSCHSLQTAAKADDQLVQ